MPYRITERARDGSERKVFDTGSAETCARFFCALLGRATLTVLRAERRPVSGSYSTLPEFVQRPAFGVVRNALNPTRNNPPTFTAGVRGKMYRAEHYHVARAKHAPCSLPPGLYDLTRLTMRGAVSIEPGRRHA